MTGTTEKNEMTKRKKERDSEMTLRKNKRKRERNSGMTKRKNK